MDGAKLRHWRNLLDDMVAEKDIANRNERARMTSEHSGRLRRIDKYACIVVCMKRHRNCVITHARRVRQHLELVHVEAVHETILAVDDRVNLHARVVVRRDHLEPGEEL